MVKISIIAAIGKNRELGRGGRLLWHIDEDLKRFRQLTEGHVVVMGRKTFDSLPDHARPLPNRINIVVSKSLSKTSYIGRTLSGVMVVGSVEEALVKARELEKKEIFIIGGSQIYVQTINLAHKLYLTVVEGTYKADVFFPDYSLFNKKIIAIKKTSDGYQYEFIELEKN